MAAPLSLRLVDPEQPQQEFAAATFDLGGQDALVTIEDDGSTRIEHPDGSVTFQEKPAKKDHGGEFFRNLADEIDENEIGLIASDLLTGIQFDIDSRKEWLETRATGVRLLGLKLEEPRGDVGSQAAPLEGMSQIRHPLLLEATIRFQATARGELLPASGPVKVRNDLPARPDALMASTSPFQPPEMGHNGPPPEGDAMDELGAALEKDMNHFLTVTATEYVPDTDRMLFYVGFGGDGFKKVYNHILKRRPVSESVDAEDIIVSNAAIDIRNCGRFTHRIKMRPSMLRRMQLAGAYRDIPLPAPNPEHGVNELEQEKADVGGYRPKPMQPKDAEYEVYECYCELDLESFAPKQFKDEGVPLPYVVTIERGSRTVLAVTRNWNEDDDQCLAKQFFVQFPFIRGLGFYGLGLIHILGNVTMALTAIWRIMIDNGMFANFPGFLFAQGAGRQNSNQLRVPPGGGAPVQVPPGMDIRAAFMPLPYKETGPSFTNLATHIEEVGQRLGQTADLNIGEGKQDVPVGTTMAIIEQATKIMDAVHKRLHAAQAEEFGLLKERFREDPESFWRHNKRPARVWTIEQFKQALDERELVPVSDPNNPTSLHRIAKATIIDMLATKYPQDIDKRAALKKIMRVADIDSEGLLTAQTQQPPPDPRIMAVQAKAQAEQMKAQIDQAKVLIQAQTAKATFEDKEKERAFKQQMQQYELQLEQMRVQAEMIIHAHDLQQGHAKAQQGMAIEQAQATHGIIADAASRRVEMSHNQQQHQESMAADRERQQQEMTAQKQRHDQQMEQQNQKHAAELEQKKAMAAVQRAQAARKPKGPK